MLSKKAETNLSRALSQYLRHKPEKIDIKLDESGFTSVDTLINNFNYLQQERIKKNEINSFTKEMLFYIVENDQKGRYEFSNNNNFIRCIQGHSHPSVKIKYEIYKLEHDVYHGTSPDFIDSIFENGLLPQKRQFVHLSKDLDTAKNVGKRHSKNKEPVILVIKKDTPITFYITNNGVIHAKSIPSKYLSVLS